MGCTGAASAPCCVLGLWCCDEDTGGCAGPALPKPAPAGYLRRAAPGSCLFLRPLPSACTAPSGSKAWGHLAAHSVAPHACSGPDLNRAVLWVLVAVARPRHDLYYVMWGEWRWDWPSPAQRDEKSEMCENRGARAGSCPVQVFPICSLCRFLKGAWLSLPKGKLT